MKPANNAPVYASFYPGFAEIAREHGYAMAVHGSLARDLDVICIPWRDEVSHPLEVIEALLGKYALRLNDSGGGVPFMKPHGREVYTLIFDGGWGDLALDLSFTPRLPVGKSGV